MLQINKVVAKIQEYVMNVSAYPENVDYVKIDQLMQFLKEMQELELENYRKVALLMANEGDIVFSTDQINNSYVYELTNADDFDNPNLYGQKVSNVE